MTRFYGSGSARCAEHVGNVTGVETQVLSW
jgi:hypothetical protein